MKLISEIPLSEVKEKFALEIADLILSKNEKILAIFHALKLKANRENCLSLAELLIEQSKEVRVVKKENVFLNQFIRKSMSEIGYYSYTEEMTGKKVLIISL